MRARATASLLLTAGMLSATLDDLAIAQNRSEDPIVVTRKTELEWLWLGDFRFAVDLFGRREVDEVDRTNAPNIRDTEDRFEETFEVSTAGFIGHPNLVDLTLEATFGLRQENVNSDTLARRESSDEYVLAYDLNALLFKNTDLPILFYAERSEQNFNRQFGASLENTFEEHGVLFTIRAETAPTFIRLFRRSQDQSGDVAASDFNLDQDTIEWQSQVNFGIGNFLTWDYTYDDVVESGEARVDRAFDRHDGLAIHTLDFGADDQHELRSSVHFFKQSGSNDLDRFRWNERLRLELSEYLETTYDFTIDRQARTDSKQTLKLGNAYFRHELYDSLVTTGDVGFSYLDTSQGDFKSEQRFGGLQLDYTKQVPGGLLTAVAAGRASWQRDGENGGFIQVTDEPRSFGPIGVIVIERRNVILSSIVVTDLAGFQTYIENIDYVVFGMPDRVEVRRVIGGAIAPGETVLLDYRIGPEPANETTTAGYSLLAQYEFQEGPLTGLLLRVRYRELDEEREADLPIDLPENDITELTYGMEYDIGGLSLEAEHRRFDSTISPFNQTRLRAEFAYAFGQGSGLYLDATYDDLEFTSDGRTAQITILNGQWIQQFTPELWASVKLTWRDEKDSAGFDARGFEQEVELNWSRRQTTVYATLRNSNVDSDFSDSRFQFFHLGFRREF